MKKVKIILSVLLSAAISLGTLAIAPFEVGASARVLNFDTKSTNWRNFKKVFCFIWEYNDGEFYPWGSKKTRMSDDDGDRVWTFDLDAAKISLESGKEYAVIFSNDNGMQTYDLLVGPECYGDTAYCDGTTYEHPNDSNKAIKAAFWKGQSKEKYGPVLTITSIGNVVGTCLRPSQTKYSLFVSFLQNYLDIARSFSGKDDQTLIDDLAKDLDLTQDEIKKAIAEAGVKVDWSPQGGGEVLLGDVNTDGTVDTRDRILLSRYLAKWIGYSINHAASDMNNDGEVDAKDRIILTRHLANWSGY